MDEPKPTLHVSGTVVVIAIIALTFVGAGLAIAALFAPHGRDTTLVLGFGTAVIGPTITALVTLARADRTNQLVTDVQDKVNGHLDSHEGLTRAVAASATAAYQAIDAMTPSPRDPNARTRADDPPTPTGGHPDPNPTGSVSEPLSDQT